MSNFSQENKSIVRKILKWLFLGPVFLVFSIIAVALLYFFYCEANKAYWDHRVKELCEKDGGVTVFEKVELTREEHEQNDGNNGAIRVPLKSEKKHERYQFYKESNDREIKKSSPRVVRYEYLIYRKLDDKIIGRVVSYGRTGGDAFLIDAGTSYSCADMKTIDLDVEKKYLLLKESNHDDFC